MAKQIILTQNDYGIELETQFVNDKKKPLDITDYDVRVKIIYNNETIDTILAGHKDNTNGIAYIVLEKEHLINTGLYTTVWSVVDEDEYITAQENLYYFVKDSEGSENDNPTTDLPIDSDGILNKFKEVDDDLLALNKHTNNIYNELNHYNEHLDNINIELKNIDKTIKTIEENNVTPDIQIGTVTTLEPNQQPTVTRRGTDKNPIFDFGIPRGTQGREGVKGDRGERGPQGEQGPKGETGPQGPIGEQGPQGLPGKDGKNGIDGTNGINGQDGANGKDGITPNISIGTVTTLEAGQQATVTREGTNENPIFNFGIPKGESGDSSSSNNASIDDNTIATDKTWSSSKIEDFVLNNDDVIWSTVQGENLSVDYTKEGYLREIEIWGNTWQDTDSKNLWNPSFSTKESFGINGVAYNGYYVKLIGGLKPNTNYTLSIGKIIVPANGYYRIGIGKSDTNFNTSTVKWVISQNNNQTSTSTTLLKKYDTATTGEDGILKVWVWNDKGTSNTEWLFDVCENIQLEEGTVATDYVDYHKADLSDIQHLGELYVDEKGQPILDSENRKQYKIEVESVNKNLLDEEMEEGQINTSTGLPIPYPGRCRSVNFTKITKNTDYHLSSNCYSGKTMWTTVRLYGDNFKYLKTISNNGHRLVKFNSGEGRYIKVTANVPYNDIHSIMLEKGEVATDYIPHKSYKTTLLLPCQLMKVGNISDRLYWDNSKDRYIIEKNVYDKVYNDGDIKLTGGSVNSDGNFNCWGNIYTEGNFNWKHNFITNVPIEKASLNLYGRGDKTEINITFKNTSNLNEANEKLLDILPIKIFYIAEARFIETDIFEELKLPTFINNTYITVSGGIQGSIKAKAPIDGGKAIQSLNAKNTALSIENIKLKETNNIQDELINTTMLATDEMYMMLEPLLAETLSERSASKMVDMYVAMVQRGIKTIEQVPVRYREQVKKILDQLEK